MKVEKQFYFLTPDDCEFLHSSKSPHFKLEGFVSQKVL